MSYDHWKATNPADGMLGSSADPNGAREFAVSQDRDGFLIVNCRGEEILMSRYTSVAAAKAAIRQMVRDQINEALQKLEADWANRDTRVDP